jgi:hypothetical protein
MGIRFIRLATRIKIDLSSKARKGVSSDGGQIVLPKYVFVDDAADRFNQRCRDLFLCLTIAKPGVVRLSEGALYVNGRFLKSIDGIYSTLDEAIIYVREEIGWPDVKSLPIKKVWDWMAKFEGLRHGIGEGKIGRAIAALSYLASDVSLASNDLDIVWALMGLEAIYCHGNSGMMNQLLEKGQMLLGPINNRKRVVRDMYNLRSRVLHGNLDLPVSYSCYEGHPQYDRFHLGIYTASLLAQVMLVVTIQQLIERNLLEVKFKYALDV